MNKCSNIKINIERGIKMVDEILEVCDGTIHKDIVTKVRDMMPDEEKLQAVAEMFKLFGDYSRSRIICALVRSELCVCDIAELLGMSASAVSHQLRIMRHMRVVKSRRDGRTIYYSISDEHMSKIYNMAFEHIEEENNER